jgi:phenylpropionate dioxygenase-like ring-hydroxylating dioxygenase large terminal subunit
MHMSGAETSTRKKVLRKGEARCPGAPTTQEIIAADTVQAPAWVRSESYEFLGDGDISTDRYVDPAFAAKEYGTLWKKTWQFACREEHIPQVGDYQVYEIGHYSFIITRVAGNEIRAYYNACLHRGTKLRASGSEGNASEFKCSFHGWSWNIDGTHKETVCPWDFPHVDPKKFALPQARVEVLGGFVFINMDPTPRRWPSTSARWRCRRSSLGNSRTATSIFTFPSACRPTGS